MLDKPLKVLIVSLLMLGIFFRFSNLDKKVYWHDEAYTSMRISGYKASETLSLFDGKVRDIRELQEYLQPSQERNLTDTIDSLAIEDPQHPPLYYVMARYWVKWFGDSIGIIRSLSAGISLLAFPAIYFLCVELFESSAVGLMAVGLLAVSPFHLLYAQEARQYILWSVIILACSWALLRGLKSDKTGVMYWVIYAVSLAAGFYTFLFTGLVAFGHGIYVMVMRKKVFAYFIASACALILSVPWLLVVIFNYSQLKRSTDWTGEIKIPIWELWKAWGINITRLFFNLDYVTQPLLVNILVVLFVGIFFYSVYFLVKTTQVRVWLFILTLIGANGLFLLIPDLLFGGVRSLSVRYLIPCFLGIQLAVAYWLAANLSFKPKIWSFVVGLIFSLSVFSCVITSNATTSSIKLLSNNLPEAAEIINATDKPLLVSNQFTTNFGNLMSLSYLLEPKVKTLLFIDDNVPQIPKGFSDIFLFNPPQSVKETIEKRGNIRIDFVMGDDYFSLYKILS